MFGKWLDHYQKRVLEVQTYGDQLRIFATDAAAVEGRIRDTLSNASIDILDIRRTQPRMEEAFISLIHRQKSRMEGSAA